jgi:uridine kinase
MKYLKLFGDHNKRYKTIAIFGLPGSGKSYLANKIKKDHPDMNYTIYDDYEWMKGQHKLGKENQIVSDGFLMIDPDNRREEIIKMGEDKGVDVEFFYFENSPEKSLINTKKRWEKGEANDFQDPKSMERNIKQFSSRYDIPKGATALPVWTEK